MRADHCRLAGSVAKSPAVKFAVPPKFTVVNASKTPVHRGPICLNGTACNASPSFPEGDRRHWPDMIVAPPVGLPQVTGPPV